MKIFIGSRSYNFIEGELGNAFESFGQVTFKVKIKKQISREIA